MIPGTKPDFISYYNYDFKINTTSNNIHKLIHDSFTTAVIKRLDYDAESGFLLSGGLDSSLVCGIAAKHLKDTFIL